MNDGKSSVYYFCDYAAANFDKMILKVSEEPFEPAAHHDRELPIILYPHDLKISVSDNVMNSSV